MKCDVVLKQCKLNILILFLSEIYQLKRNKCFLITASKNFNIGLYSDVYDQIYLV